MEQNQTNISVRTEIIDGIALIILEGEMDAHNAPAVRSKVDQTLEAGINKAAFDLRGAQYIDSTSIGLLVSVYKRMQQENGNICIINPSSRVQRILMISGLDRYFSIFGSLDEAKLYLNGGE